MVDVQPDNLPQVEVGAVFAQLAQEYVGSGLLDLPVRRNGFWVEVLPKCTPVTAPPLTIGHEAEVQTRTRSIPLFIQSPR